MYDVGLSSPGVEQSKIEAPQYNEEQNRVSTENRQKKQNNTINSTALPPNGDLLTILNRN